MFEFLKRFFSISILQRFFLKTACSSVVATELIRQFTFLGTNNNWTGIIEYTDKKYLFGVDFILLIHYFKD